MEALLEDTEFHSSGVFSLSAERARRLLTQSKWAWDGWGFYQLSQAAVVWGAESITFPERGAEWSVIISNPVRFPDPGRMRKSIVELGLESRMAGERLLATAALNLGASEVQISWGRGREVDGSLTLLGFPELGGTLPKCARWIRIRLKLPAHPVGYSCFSGCRAVYAPLEVRVGEWIRPTSASEANPNQFVSGEYFWLEYFPSRPDQPAFRHNPSGRTKRELGVPCSNIPGRGRVTSDLRCKGDEGPGDLLILVHWGFGGPSYFYPIQSGVLLSALTFPDLPPGFHVVFDANGLETDLSGHQLIHSDRLEERLRGYLPEIVKACHLLENHGSKLSRKTPFYIPCIPFLNIIFVLSWLCVFQMTAAGLLVGGFFAILSTWAFVSVVKEYCDLWLPLYNDRKLRLATATQLWSEAEQSW